MKRAIIGGFISLIGSIWAIAFIIMGASDLISSELNIMLFFVLSILCTIVGICLMLIEYFKKD